MSSEKVDGGNGKLYTRDHPHEIISPHVMRFAEIREWLRILSTDPAYGWYPGGRSGLQRALGMTPTGIERKLSTGWIWPKEQVRITARIRDVLSGYIVPTRFGNRVEGVITDPPRPPIVGNAPKFIHLSAKPGAVRLKAHDAPAAFKLPSFSRAFSEAIVWDPDSKKARRVTPG
jgi:hypothetical protein